MSGSTAKDSSAAGGPLRVLGVIPARYGSTRFPGKPLVPVAGEPLVVHVVRRARESTRLTRVVVATDDERIAAAAQLVGADVLLTGEVATGSDRVAAATAMLAEKGETFDAVANIQGDEPLLPGAAMDEAIAALTGDDRAQIATLAVPAGREQLDDPNVVKVVLNRAGYAMYFSRAPIPFPRGDGGEAWQHVGMYVFRTTYLEEYVRLPVPAVERTEALEQLRALHHGARIRVVTGNWPALGVDTPEDLKRVEAILRSAG